MAHNPDFFQMGQRTNLKDTARESATPRMTEVLFLAHKTPVSDETFLTLVRN